MQTFLPVADFWGSATLLDRQRLGKQRVENYQIMQALTGLTVSQDDQIVPYEPPASIAKHWVTALWRGHTAELLDYQDACLAKTYSLANAVGALSARRGLPAWFGDLEFHAQHRGRLVSKDPVIYRELFPGVEPLEDYTFHWRQT